MTLPIGQGGSQCLCKRLGKHDHTRAATVGSIIDGSVRIMYEVAWIPGF
jgi:hypothetical protein